MLTTMTEQDWKIVLQVFQASRSRRGDQGQDDRGFLEALHYFVVHNITWRALPPAISDIQWTPSSHGSDYAVRRSCGAPIKADKTGDSSQRPAAPATTFPPTRI
jgi:hypothetical protein